jgi:predicted DNA-binding transcriptional regulator YafY
MLLQSRPNQKASQLAEQLDVSVRTVQRYIRMLEEMGIPVYAERGPLGGYSLVRGYKMPPLVLTPEEAVAVHLGTSLVEEMWGQLYGDAAQGALAKLENLLPNEQRHEIAWARRSLAATHMHRGDITPLTPILEKLRRASRERRQIYMHYQGRAQADPTQRHVDSYALAHRWGWWYLVGYCHLRQALRTFRVDRIRELSLLEETFEWPAEFDLHAYLESELSARPQIRVQLHFLPQAADLVRAERFYWDEIEEQEDGSIIATQMSDDLAYTARMTLSAGPNVIVLEPETLRQLVLEQANAVLALYKTGSEHSKTAVENTAK